MLVNSKTALLVELEEDMGWMGAAVTMTTSGIYSEMFAVCYDEC